MVTFPSGITGTFDPNLKRWLITCSVCGNNINWMVPEESTGVGLLPLGKVNFSTLCPYQRTVGNKTVDCATQWEIRADLANKGTEQEIEDIVLLKLNKRVKRKYTFIQYQS